MALNRQTDENGKPIVMLGDNYSWVKGEVRDLSSLFLDTESVERIETTIGGLKNFFKSRAERGHSASNVVKTEEGGVVNKPAESRRVPSMKRRRAEAGSSGKEKVIDLTSNRCCGKEVSLEEVKLITEKQKKLHGYTGEEDLTSVWSEHFLISVVAEEHFQSKTDLDLIDSVDGVTRAQFVQVYAARLLCIGKYEELKAKEEAEQKKKEEGASMQKTLELERKLKVAFDQLAVREKEIVVELAVEKKEAEKSKENHGYAMLEIGFERARKQAEFFYLDLKFDNLDPIKVVHNSALVDDDEVDVEGGGDHDPEE
ncbi:hypothetical protein PIB30_050421 [Stylosanthes scabra]|uniref:Uncharacterized protein n=1 Tax=Stylosanthes scabra TaxID=79078 RepID=A0ABU6YF26_9FABA|nr:hypothetical protein [Stylosanthes scabra]